MHERTREREREREKKLVWIASVTARIHIIHAFIM
jgi:hypothetical protein